jgi:hypothetical protein
VLLLLAIDLFLHKMEFSSLTLENFNTNMFVMKDEYLIEALNIKVKGKRKRKRKRRRKKKGKSLVPANDTVCLFLFFHHTLMTA